MVKAGTTKVNKKIPKKYLTQKNKRILVDAPYQRLDGKPSKRTQIRIIPSELPTIDELDFSGKYKKSPRAVAAILAALSQGCTLRQAAQAAGIKRGCILRWRIEDPKFDEAIEKAKLNRVVIVEDAMFSAAAKENVEAGKFFLKNQKPTVWKDKQDVDYSGNINLIFGHRKPKE